MKRKQYGEEKIISILEEHEAGASVPELAPSVLQIVDFSISGQRVANELERRHSESPITLSDAPSNRVAMCRQPDFSAQQ